MNKLGSFCSQGAHNLAGKMHEEKSHIIKHIIKEKYSEKEHSVLAAGGSSHFSLITVSTESSLSHWKAYFYF